LWWEHEWGDDYYGGSYSLYRRYSDYYVDENNLPDFLINAGEGPTGVSGLATNMIHGASDPWSPSIDADNVNKYWHFKLYASDLYGSYSEPAYILNVRAPVDLIPEAPTNAQIELAYDDSAVFALSFTASDVLELDDDIDWYKVEFKYGVHEVQGQYIDRHRYLTGPNETPPPLSGSGYVPGEDTVTSLWDSSQIESALSTWGSTPPSEFLPNLYEFRVRAIDVGNPDYGNVVNESEFLYFPAIQHPHPDHMKPTINTPTVVDYGFGAVGYRISWDMPTEEVLPTAWFSHYVVERGEYQTPDNVEWVQLYGEGDFASKEEIFKTDQGVVDREGFYFIYKVRAVTIEPYQLSIGQNYNYIRESIWSTNSTPVVGLPVIPYQTFSFEQPSTDVEVPTDGSDIMSPFIKLTRDSSAGALTVYCVIGAYTDGTPANGTSGNYGGGTAAWSDDYLISTAGNVTNHVDYVTFNAGQTTKTIQLSIKGTDANPRTESNYQYIHIEIPTNQSNLLLPVEIMGTVPDGAPQDTVKHVVNILPPTGMFLTLTAATVWDGSQNNLGGNVGIGSGITTPTSYTGPYEPDTWMNINAVPNEDFSSYAFSGWSGHTAAITDAGGSIYDSFTYIEIPEGSGVTVLTANFYDENA